MADLIQDLELQIQQAANLPEKIETLNSLALKLRFRDMERAISISHEVRQIVQEEDPQDPQVLLGLANSLRNLGGFYTQLGEYDQALKVLLEAQELYQNVGDDRDNVIIQTQIGGVYLYLSSFVNALTYTLKGLELAQQMESRELEGTLLNNLATIYILRQEYSRALPYLLKTLQIAEDAGDKKTQADALDNICIVYRGLNNTPAALSSGLKSLQMYRDLGDRQGEAEVLNSLGRAYQAMKDYPRALECYSDAKRLAKNISLKYEVVGALLNIGSVYADQQLAGQALDTLHNALTIAEEINAKGRLVETHQSLSAAYRMAHQFQKALYHYESFHKIKEQVFNDDTENKLRNLEVVYQVEAARREAEIEQLKNVALKQEVNERVQAQQALQAANEQLKQEISEREKLIGDLNAFASMVAHDLKNPLQNLAFQGKLLEYRLKEANASDEAIHMVQQILQTGKKANTIINELLVLASLRNQDVVLQSLDTPGILKEVENRLSYMMEESGAEIIKPNEWPAAFGHPAWVEEVWSNYISNAIKYGGKPPRIELGAGLQVDGWVCFWIRDNGDGISLEDQQRLFQDFSRVGKVRASGHGLGLSIVKRIVDKMGGVVGVDSDAEPGRGCTFWFTLPSIPRVV